MKVQKGDLEERSRGVVLIKRRQVEELTWGAA
jgi:hypothetical protein